MTLPRLMLMACLLAPSLSWALGLGEIHLKSALNEPMNAEIDLIAAGPDELNALRAALAPKDAFTRYGIDRPPFLSTLTFKVGKSKDGRDVLLVRSTDSIPEPFVTFLVEVNWARGRLMREYTVLLDPPVYTPGERANAAAPVAAATTAPATPPAAAPSARNKPAPAAAAASPTPDATTAPTPAKTRSSRAGRSSSRASSASTAAASTPAPRSEPSPSEPATAPASDGTYHVAQGDTLTKIARSLHAGTRADMDQTMIAMYRANPDAFGGNINILRRGSVLRIPGGDEVAALNQSEAMSEVHRQMEAWRGNNGAATTGHLRLVTPGAGSGTSNSSSDSASTGEAQALKGRVKDLEGQLADAHRLLDLKNNELSELQRKLGSQPPAPTPAPAPQIAAAPPAPASTPAPVEAPPSAAQTPAPAPAESATPPAPPAPKPAPKPATAKKPPPPAQTGSWIDWLQQNWWLPAAIIIALIAGLAITSWRRRQSSGGGGGDFPALDSTDITEFRDPSARVAGSRGSNDSFVVEESGEHPMPDFNEPAERYGETTADLKAPDDTMSSESAVNLDQGDPLAEADFHMAYGLYDQAADLVRIALEREPDRRDLRLKLLEIYFVWGNKEAFLQTAKGLESTRDRAPAGEWDKIVIMGKQICPDEPLFASTAGSGRGAGALVDLNLEGGENRVDIDLFGDPEGERSIDQTIAKDTDDTAATGESPGFHAGSDLDFTLDRPERGADESPTREMAPRDEPTVESELMNFADAPTAESPTLKPTDLRDRISSKLDKVNKADQTAELSIDDLGLDLDHLEGPASGASISIPRLEETDHPADAPTMVAGLDEKSRRMMQEAESRARDKDLTELERELEASFVADLGSDHEEVKTAVLGPESAPTVQMPRGKAQDAASTSRFKSPEFSDVQEPERPDVDSTSRLRGLNADSIDLDLDRLANALGSGDTVEQPRAEDEVFSTEVFEASQRNRKVDLDVGEALNGSEAAATNKLKTITTVRSNKIKTEELSLPELEPVTMSEVGTKLDLARAYMDMGDPEGARSILEEVVSEGSASQKQEAQRLIENLPG
ncbi:MAG TPA: FimV/HubP family polar landmark protein [Steroidobacteraceae bacterium]|nr:FimV/HubP family polar landmark protein [Steroidobacteraceae bacterium]